MNTIIGNTNPQDGTSAIFGINTELKKKAKGIVETVRNYIHKSNNRIF